MGDVVRMAELRQLRDLLRVGQRRLEERAAHAHRLRLTERWRLHPLGFLAHPAFAGFTATCGALALLRAGAPLDFPLFPLVVVALTLASVGIGFGASERAHARLARRLCALRFGVAGSELLWTRRRAGELRLEPLFQGPVPTPQAFHALLAAAGLEHVEVRLGTHEVPVLVLETDRPGSSPRAVQVLERVFAPLHPAFPLLAVRLVAADPAAQQPRIVIREIGLADEAIDTR